MLVFWVVTPCGLVGRYQCFGGTYCLNFQNWKAHNPKDQHRHLNIRENHKSTTAYKLLLIMQGVSFVMISVKLNFHSNVSLAEVDSVFTSRNMYRYFGFPLPIITSPTDLCHTSVTCPDFSNNWYVSMLSFSYSRGKGTQFLTTAWGSTFCIHCYFWGAAVAQAV
jgi:hypothetical protein